MAHEFYITLEGTKQGKFKGESRREGFKDRIEGLRFAYEIVSPRDPATGQASGKRQHGPVSFVKEWGAATPQIFQALVTNELLSSVLMEFLKVEPDGQETIYYRVRLVNASITNLRQYTEMTAPGAKELAGEHPAGLDLRELEQASLIFERIEIENQDANTSAADDWYR